MPILRRKDQQKAKNLNLKFVIDCTEPKEDKVLNLDEFVSYLQSRIKVQGKTGNLGNDVTVAAEQDKVVVTSTIPFSKRYLKYLTKKYLKQETLREYLYVHSLDKATYQLKYFNVGQDEEEQK
ncbi:unnamed protein product (macronuclear) [Paramecium tetraurelia]|uniref:Large ribosomal subunit protein eL22 n=2 Tax=Paramecium TaxID=5884 RepID=A0DVP7_PARTE|nr:uncharacterized protein GSPATT00020767001 [Paramecium tetraurelia]CAD8178693.1 unnamed protein product [Paramecium octaurelia]CAK87114.1 unnamed protein product [Paramecium tetraurelia]|eukprot:XP_001454511.1 hypothetical protein (macronuclear) [Paramecium tetraurelia strain d4-2]